MHTIASGQFAGRQSGCEDIDLSPAAALTADITSSVLELGGPKPCRLTLNVSSVSASDTLDLTIQGSETNDFSTSGEYRTLATFTQVTAAGKQTLSFVGARFIRANYNVTGTDVSIPCTLKGEVRF
jgi:hypothetical protein